MSGTELMEEIEEVTGWRPSPGSIYPLLAKLRKESSIERVESDTPGFKSFTLTETGRDELERHKQRRGLIRDRYYSMRRIYLKLVKEMDEGLFKASLRLFDVIEEIDGELKEKNETSTTVQSILNKATQEIEEIRRQLNDER
jgi:DNA-binding PadR family transcriptional regulator